MIDRPLSDRNAPGGDAARAPLDDEARQAMMRRVKEMPVADRIALLDRLCRESTRIAGTAVRVR